MEQRRLRLGDILDDYCPRERRVTNHAVVAMVEEDVKQTRCTTCDAEHAYKGGREPRRRKKDSSAALYREVLADMPETPPPAATTGVPEPREAEPLIAESEEPVQEQPAEEEAAATPLDPVDEGPINRPLIRATLPRPEGQKEVRQMPEFTIRQKPGRNQFRGSHRPQAGNGNGNRPHARRFQGGQSSGMPGRGSSGGGGFRGGGTGQQRHGNRKRSR